MGREWETHSVGPHRDLQYLSLMMVELICDILVDGASKSGDDNVP